MTFRIFFKVEKGERLKQLEERILKKSGLWNRFLMQHHQKKVINDNRLKRSKQLSGETDFLQMIFGAEEGQKEEKIEKDDEGKMELKILEEDMSQQSENNSINEKKIHKQPKRINRRQIKRSLTKKKRKEKE